MNTMIIPVIGQEAVCPDGLGRVIDYNVKPPNQYIQVRTYYNNRDCKWDYENVHLVPIPGRAPDVEIQP